MNRSQIEYLSGEKLYGDDFDYDQIVNWYEDEKEGYSGLVVRADSEYRYVYHALNRQHGFQFLKECTFDKVLGIGSAFGDEFAPIKEKIGHLTILDPSEKFSASKVLADVPCNHKKPNIDGTLDFPDFTFDLIVCLGTLHHIPNVSYVLREAYRCLRSGGTMLVREPIVSMGDWTKPRKGLTKRERGIPRRLLKEAVSKAGFTIVRESLCNFAPLAKLSNAFGTHPYNSELITQIDGMFSSLFGFNDRYHRKNLISKFGPASLYLVLEK